MTTTISAEEWFKENYKTSTVNVVKLMESYSTYLLNHHLEQFAEECKCKTKTKFKQGTSFRGEIIIDKQSIDQTLTDYKLKNNIK